MLYLLIMFLLYKILNIFNSFTEVCAFPIYEYGIWEIPYPAPRARYVCRVQWATSFGWWSFLSQCLTFLAVTLQKIKTILWRYVSGASGVLGSNEVFWHFFKGNRPYFLLRELRSQRQHVFVNLKNLQLFLPPILKQFYFLVERSPISSWTLILLITWSKNEPKATNWTLRPRTCLR